MRFIQSLLLYIRQSIALVGHVCGAPLCACLGMQPMDAQE